jgi:PAS domain S-box-containing protein
MGTEAHHSIVHPDDLPKTFDVFQEISQSRDKEIWSYEYRLKNEQGSYIWMCNTICIFKKDDAGFPIEIIGNVINIHSEKEVNEQLLKRKEELKISEELYKQAQALSHIGHFALHLKSNNLYLTEELKRIYDLDLSKDKFEYNDIIDLRHQEDAELVTEKIENTLKSYEPFDFEYRIITTKGVEKVVHAIGEIKFDEEGQADQLVGTIQDVSEQHKILEELQKRDHQHKQAEALTHIGSYKLNLENDKIEWSDEMYRIYGFDPSTKQIIKGTDIARFTHPEDREYVSKELAESINQHKPLDFYFRILLDDGTLKILHARGEVVFNNGKPLCLVGTTQDVTEKQLLIKRLQESENLHKQAQAMAQLGNWTFDLKTQSYTWSEEMCRIYELESSKDFTVEKWADYIHPEERESVLAYLQECIATKQPYDRQHRIVLPGGKIKTLHRKGEIVLDHNGEPIKLVGTTQDITEQFRIQQELKENQIFIKKIADATPSIIASYNINTGTYTFISHGIKTLLGYEAEEAKTKGVQFFIDIIHPDDIAPLMEANKEALAKANLPENQNRDEVMEFVYRMRHIAGHYLWFHTYGTVFDRNASGHVEHVLNISLDITEQHEAVQKIKEQEHFIQHIADASPTVLYVFDIKTNSIIYVNREIFFVLGYTRDEILSMSGSITSQLYHPDDIELLPERKQSPKKILESDVMHQYECRIKNKEGEWQWFLVREVVFKTDDEGKVTQIVGAALDISRRKEMEKTLLQNSFLLEQSNASLEEFAYVASHDLKSLCERYLRLAIVLQIARKIL